MGRGGSVLGVAGAAAALVMTTLAGTAGAATTPAATTPAATTARATGPGSAGPVRQVPASWTPQILGTESKVRQLTPCGPLMYAAGTFAQVASSDGKTTYKRANVFSFDASTGTVTTWAPQVDGIVNSVALSADCRTAYLGGSFTTVNHVAARNLVAVDAATGQVLNGFARNVSAQVQTVFVSGSHVLVGGYFSSINGSSAHRYVASLNPLTGKDDGFLDLRISGTYVYPGVQPNGTRVYNTEVSHDGSRLLVMGDFTSVGGQHREQIFMLDLATGQVTGWTSDAFYAKCATVEPFYLQAAAWSWDDSAVYVATTGYKPYNKPAGSTPRTGLCDATAAFPSSPVDHPKATWINYTGCDSLFSVAADQSMVYVGGHHRWISNPRGCDFAGPGAIPAPGVSGIDPTTGAGSTAWNPTRDRGQGADDMLVTAAGLWVASDTFFGSKWCGGFRHPGVCFFPY
jgi:hypothetical protein